MFSFHIYGNLLAQAPDIAWTKIYGGAEREIGNSVYQTIDGGYIISGITQSFGSGMEDIYLIKTDANGNTLWTKTFGGTEEDWGRCVKQTSDNGYIIAAHTFSFGKGNGDVYLIKTDAKGDTLWTRTYGGTEEDRGNVVQQTPDNGYIIAGFTMSFGSGNADAYLIKTDANGSTLWTKTFGGSNDDSGNSVQQTSDSGYIVAGNTYSLGASNINAYLIKTDANGDTLWTRTYGGVDLAIGFSVKQTSDNGYILAGAKSINIAENDFDFYLVKTNSNGDTLWTRTYGGTDVDICLSVLQTPDGGYFLAGTKTDTPEGAFDYSAANDIYLVRTDSNGDVLWTKTLGGTDHDAVGEGSTIMQQTSDNGYIIVGSTESYGMGSIDVWLIKILPEAAVSVENDNIPSSFALFQNYPNPFNPVTEINFVLPSASRVSLEVFNVLGQKLATLVDEKRAPGNYRVEWDGDGFPCGVYIYRMKTEAFTSL